jgi:molybdopterin adenylyltransferase
MLKFGLLITSDRASKGIRPDETIPLLESAIRSAGWQLSKSLVIPDDSDLISEKLVEWANAKELDVILTSGGTGFSPRDVTPEATRSVIERETPGISEGLRASSLTLTPHAMLSRGISGIRGKTLIVNLPGNPKAALENFQFIAVVLEHAVALIQDDPSSQQHHQKQ